MSWWCFWWGNTHLFQLGFPTVSFLLASPYQHSRHLEFLGCFQLNFAEQKQFKLIFHELHGNRWVDKGGSTNSHFQFIDCGVSLTVPLLARQRICTSWGGGRGADEVSSRVHKMVCLIVLHAHKVVVEPTFVKVYQKRKLKAGSDCVQRWKAHLRNKEVFPFMLHSY